ncbi:hypothetical protein AGLY_010041 [Aphis glycines]|uniref:Uncharacterized protein n=1 Tax=Aphis glycines TaxID=307491 RepID=A0A6G0TIH7_APHGL|nr:hypothetical protein AGLY_010041 [Aphis glycines]
MLLMDTGHSSKEIRHHTSWLSAFRKLVTTTNYYERVNYRPYTMFDLKEMNSILVKNSHVRYNLGLKNITKINWGEVYFIAQFQAFLIVRQKKSHIAYIYYNIILFPWFLISCFPIIVGDLIVPISIGVDLPRFTINVANNKRLNTSSKLRHDKIQQYALNIFGVIYRTNYWLKELLLISSIDITKGSRWEVSCSVQCSELCRFTKTSHVMRNAARTKGRV